MDVFIEFDTPQLSSGSSSRDLVPLPAVCAVLETGLLGIPLSQSIESRPSFPRAPPACINEVHLSIATTVLRI